MKENKRKGNGILACIIVFVICAAMVGTAIGLTNMVLNKFSLEYTGQNYGKLKALISGILDKDTDKIEASLDNPYDETALQGFYTKIKNTLFLKDDYEFNTDKIYDSIFSNDGDITTNALMKKTFDMYGFDEDTLSLLAAESEGEETDNSAILNLLYDILRNIDVNKLKVADNFTLSLTDREVAAFVNDLLMKVLSDPDNSLLSSLGDALSQYNLELDKLVTLNQLSFYSQKDEADGQDVIMLKATASLKTREAALSFIENFAAENNLPSLLKSLASSFIKMYIPQKSFVTAEMGLSRDVGLKINLNRLNDDDMDTIYNLIGKFTGKDIKESLNNAFSDATQSLYKTINDTVNIAEFLVADHTIEIPVFDMTLDMTINKKLTENNLSGISIREVVDIISSEAPAIGSEYDFRNWYRQHEGDDEKDWIYVLDNEWEQNAAGDWIYKGNDAQYKGVTLTEQNLVKFEDEFIKSMQSSYGLDSSLTFDEVIDTFTNGDGSDQNEIADMFDAEKLRQLLQSENTYGVELNDRMIAAIVNSQMDTLLKENDFGDALELAYVALTEKEVNTKKHNVLALGLNIDFKKLIASVMGDNDELVDIISELLPSNALLTVSDVDITSGLADNEYLGIKIGYNDISGENLGKYLDILKSLAGFDTSELDSVSVQVREILDNMNSVIPVKLGNSKMEFPEIYETLTYVLNGQLEEQDRVDADQLKSSLKLLFKSVDFQPFDSEKYERELNEVLMGKYPLKEEGGIDNLKNMLDGENIAIADILDNEKLGDLVKGYQGNDTNSDIKEYLSSKRPRINGNQILSLVLDKVNETLNNYGDARPELSSMALSLQDGKEFIEITLSAALSGFLGNTDDTAMKLLKKILPDSTLISIKVEITKGVTADNADKEIKINNGDSKALFDIIKKFDSENSIGDIENEIAEAVIEAFDDMRDSVNLDVVATQDASAELLLPDVFSLAESRIGKDKDFAADGFDSDVNLFRAMRIMLDTSRVKQDEFKPIDDDGEAAIISAIKEAYYIKDTVKADTFDELTQALGDTSDISSLFELDKVKFEIPEEAIIAVSHLGGVFKDKLGDDCKFDNIVSLSIDEKDTREVRAIVEIDNFGSLFEGEQTDDLASLLTESFFVEVVIKGDSTQFAINGFIGDELKPLYKVAKELGTDIEETLHTQGQSISDSVSDAFDSLEKDIGYKRIEDDSIILYDIFGILKKKIDDLEETKYDSEQIREAVQGLYDKNDASPYKGTEFNYDESTFVNNVISDQKFDLMSEIAKLSSAPSVRVTDRDLGSYINENLAEQEAIDVRQLKILTTNKTDEENKFIDEMENVSSSETVILITAELDIESIMGTKSGNGADLIPQKALVTFAFSIDENGDFVYKDFRLNDMTSVSLDIVLKIVGTDTEYVNNQISSKAATIKGVVDKAFTAAKLLNAKISYAAVSDGESGRGVLQFSKS